jgi:hypothetical protein
MTPLDFVDGLHFANLRNIINPQKMNNIDISRSKGKIGLIDASTAG